MSGNTPLTREAALALCDALNAWEVMGKVILPQTVNKAWIALTASIESSVSERETTNCPQCGGLGELTGIGTCPSCKGTGVAALKNAAPQVREAARPAADSSDHSPAVAAPDPNDKSREEVIPRVEDELLKYTGPKTPAILADSLEELARASILSKSGCQVCEDAAGLIRRLSRSATKACEWRQDQDGTYNTGCGHQFFYDSGTAEENDAKFCQYCGGTLKSLSFVDPFTANGK